MKNIRVGIISFSVLSCCYFTVHFSIAFSQLLTPVCTWIIFFLNSIHHVAYLQDFMFRNVHPNEACGLKSMFIMREHATIRPNKTTTKDVVHKLQSEWHFEGHSDELNKRSESALFNRCKITIALHLFEYFRLMLMFRKRSACKAYCTHFNQY